MSRVQHLMRDMDTDAALITSPINRRYYTGFHSSAGTLVLTRGESVLIIDSRYHEAATKQAGVDRVVLQDSNLYKHVAEILSKNGAGTLGVESGTMTLSAFATWQSKLLAIPEAAHVELVADDKLTELIASHRAAKTAGELACIREAQRITDMTFAHIVD